MIKLTQNKMNKLNQNKMTNWPRDSSEFQELRDVDENRDGDGGHQVVEGALLEDRGWVGAHLVRGAMVRPVVKGGAHRLKPALPSHNKRVADGHVPDIIKY